MSDSMKKYGKRWQTVALLTFIFAAIVFSISTIFTPKYRTDISVLVIQRQPNDKVDAFSAARSAEYLSDILAKVAYSDAFMESALKAPFEISRKFSANAEERKEEWKKTISVKKVNNTGIINISVFDQSKKESENIAKAIAWNYSNNGVNFHGAGEQVSIKLIDGPIVSQNPAVPNVPLNTLLGAIAGLVASFSLIYFYDFDIRFSSEKRKEMSDDTVDKKEETVRTPITEIPMNFNKTKNFGALNLLAKMDDVYPIRKKAAAVLEVAEKKDEISAEEKIESPEVAKREVIASTVFLPNDQENAAGEIEGSADGAIPVFKDETIPTAPENLPVMEENSHPWKEEEQKPESQRPTVTDIYGDVSEVREPNDVEVKERLNRLLKGDL